MNKVLELEEVSRTFSSGVFRTHTVRAVDRVSFALERGKTFGLVGNSGCGKTTLSRMITRVLKPSGGRIRFEGEDIARLDRKGSRAYHRRVQIIFQNPEASQDPSMRIRDSLLESMAIHRLGESREERMEKIRAALGQVGLPNPELVAKRYPHTMSGGQRQRVMIAMAMACNPKILFADEPTTALDVTMQAQILDLMNHLKEKRGTSILLITHDLGVVAKMADRIAVMYAGKIVEYGDARQVFYRPSHPYTWGLLGAMPNLIQDVKSELYAIPGTPPDLYAPPKGCAFAARCPYAMEACLKEDPPEFACGQGHGSRCWLLDPRAPDVTPPEGIPPLPKGGSDHV